MNTVTALEPMPLCVTSEPAPVASSKIRKPRVWTAFATWFAVIIVGTLCSLLAFVAVGVAIGIVTGAHGADAAQVQARIQELCQRPFPALLLSLIPFQLGMIGVVLFAARRSKEPIQERLGLLTPTGPPFSNLKLFMTAAFTLSTAFAAAIIAVLTIGLPKAANPINAVINDGSWWALTALSIVLSVIPALVEETFFRGYLQRRFLQRWSPAVAISVSTLLFALMHLDSLQHIIAVVPLGLVNGLLAYRTNSVKPGMLVHAIHNTGVVAIGGLATALVPHIGEDAVGMLLLGTIGVLGLIGLPAIVSLLRSAKPQPAAETPVVETTAVAMPAAEPVVEPLSVRSRELSLPNFLIDSRLASTAV
jgi:membrane protease YdiL (CAAX protease family)